MGYDRENSYSIEVIDLTDDASVSSGGGINTQSLQPPVGYIYEVIDIGYNAPIPGGGGSGTHELFAKYRGEYSDVIRIIAGFGSVVRIDANGFIQTGGSELPSTSTQQYEHMRNEIIHASNSVPFDFIYTNDTDVAQAGTRELTVVVKKYHEGA